MAEQQVKQFLKQEVDANQTLAIEMDQGGDSAQVQDFGDAEMLADSQLIQLEDGTQITLRQFVDYHRETVSELKAENAYLIKHFELFHKFHYVYELIRENYLDILPNFMYREMLSDLEADLDLFIAEDQDRYSGLMKEVNLDFEITTNETNQFEFVEEDMEVDTQADSSVELETRRFYPGEKTSRVNRLPGQKTAPDPQCPVCHIFFRCRIKLESHLQDEHEDNPNIVCPRENCNVTFNLKSYSQHMKDFHSKNDTVCDACNEMFPDRVRLIQHYKLHIRKKDRLTCNQPGCNYSDLWQGRLDRHKKLAHGIDTVKQFTCPVESCGRVFRDRPSFYSHSLTHKDKTLAYRHKCPNALCGAVFKRRRNLTQHMLKHNAEADAVKARRLVCEKEGCSKVFYKEKEMKKHLETQHGDASPKKKKSALLASKVEILQPGTSKDSAKGDDSVLEDKFIPLEDDEGSDEASDMDEEGGRVIDFDSKNLKPGMNVMAALRSASKSVGGLASSNDSLNQSLDGHLSMFGNEVVDVSLIENPRCELCDINFETGNDMAEHLKDRHHQYTIKQYVCGFENCQYQTYFRSVLGKHKNSVHGGKYQCDFCGKLSKDSGNHNRHRNIHKNVVYRCRYENCDARYKSSKAFYVHVLSHSNEQPIYQCEHEGCNYTTHYVNTLNVHKLTHTDIRRFFCPYDNCGKGFKRNGDLNKHVMHSHRGVKRPPKKKKSARITRASAAAAAAAPTVEVEDDKSIVMAMAV